MYTLKNDVIEISVAEKGAELKSLIKNNREYMWQANPEFWGRTAPVLFPIVGSLKGKQFITGGRAYPMGQHGFARDNEFVLLSMTEDSITMRLQSNEDLIKKYPFDFYLDITYTLKGSSVITTWKVTNPGKNPISFSIGGHPAFNCEPSGYSYHLYEGEKLSDGFSYCQLNSDGLRTDELFTMKTPEGRLPISKALFEKDALIVTGSIDRVAIADNEGNEYLTVSFDTDLFGLWSPAGKEAPFVCIEPWYGEADAADFNGSWEDRERGNTLAAGASFEASYTITV